MSDQRQDLGIGYLYLQSIREGQKDFDIISNKFQDKKDSLVSNGEYCYDRYTLNGSSSNGIVVDEKNNQKDKIIWCINHYLGLNDHPLVKKKAIKAIKKYGTGSGTSAMSGGRSLLHSKLEDILCEFTHKESVTLFSTGYTANLGAISGLFQANDIIIADEEVHASIHDGIKLSPSKKVLFKHNSLEDLEKKLFHSQDSDGNVIVMLESAYSMSGDLAPLKEIVKLKEKYKFYIYLDEAHTFGIYGKNGKGYAFREGVLDQIDFFVSTLSKSCASIGGFIACKEKHSTLLQCRANSYIFQATIPPADVAASIAALKVIYKGEHLRKDLHQRNAYFRKELKKCGFNLGNSESPVIPIYIQDVATLNAFSKDMYTAGIFAVSVVYPAVPALKGRIRLILTSHSYIDIDKTILILKKLGNKHEVFAPAYIKLKKETFEMAG